MSTLTQISNLFNLMVQQPNSGLNFYHFGWRSDINKNIDNNFDPGVQTGRQFPALQFHVPEYTEQEANELQFTGFGEKIQCTLWFDKLQDYENDGSLDTDNLIEQWQELKKIADVFMINFNQLYSNYYQAGHIEGVVRFIPRSNLHNDRLITWEVNFDLVHVVDCVDILDQIDTSQFPATFADVSIIDIENYNPATPPSRCDLILQQLSNDDLLNCILPTYDFADVETQNATTAQQQTDMSNWLCQVVAENKAMSFNGVNASILGEAGGVYDLERTDAHSFMCWVKVRDLTAFVSKWEDQTGFLFRGLIDGRILCTMRTGAFLAGRTISGATDFGSFPINEWFLYGHSYSGNQFASGLNFYVNAVNKPFVASVDGINQPFTMTNNVNIEIGSSVDLSQFGDCDIYQAMMWNIELTATDFLNQYNQDIANINAGQRLGTPVQNANLIMLNTCGDMTQFGLDTFTFMDDSSSSLGYKSINMQQSALIDFVPNP